MKGYPLFFKVDNDRDLCDFCGHRGALLKALTTGKCICAPCVEHINGAMAAEPLSLPMHQPIKQD